MKSLELKIPPPAVAFLVGVAMWLLAQAFPFPGFRAPARLVIASVLGVAGLAVALWGVVSFRRAGTTINPLAPETASSLVHAGIYRFTRNPMYLGVLFVLAGWTVYLGSAAALLGLPAFVLYINRFQIRPEEAALAEKFGADFAAYRASVRRWL